MRRWLLLSLLGACGPGEEEEEAPPIAVRCEASAAVAWPEELGLAGVVTARPGADALVSAEEPGRLLKVLVDVGDVVAAGQALALVEPVPLEATVGTAEAEVRAAEAEQLEAQAKAVRAHHLVEVGTGSEAEAELADATLAHAEGALRAAREALRTAREHLGRATVRAPFGGVVVKLLGREGEVVDGTPATPLLELADAHQPQLLVNVAPAELPRLAVGQTARVRLGGDDAPIPAVLSVLVPVVDPATGLAAARLALDPGDRVVPLGVLGRADVALGAPEDRVAVPEAAIRVAGSERQVVTCTDGVVGIAEVTVVARRDGSVAVDGLAAGVPVVVEGVVGLEEGMALEVAP